MENENRKRVVLGGGSCNFGPEDVVIDLQNYENEIDGKIYDENFINVFEGDRHIFISRDREGDVEPTYVLIESDLVTGKMKVYKVELKEVRDMPAPQIEMLKLEKRAAYGELN